MGNCVFVENPLINRASSNAKPESPKDTNLPLVKEQEEKEEDSKLPSNPEEVENFRRDSASNPLISFSFDELNEITGNFMMENILGGGGFGIVYKGLIKEDFRKRVQSLQVARGGTSLFFKRRQIWSLRRRGGMLGFEGGAMPYLPPNYMPIYPILGGAIAPPEVFLVPPLQVAVKVHDGDNSFQGHREWLAEVLFLGKLSHPNLVKLIGYCCEDNHRVLIYEFMVRGSVEANLLSRVLPPLSWAIRMKIAFGAANGLAFLHEANIPVIYRDFKTSNILLDQDYNAKLADFGLAKDGPVGDMSHVSTRIMGTRGYADPEYMLTGHLTTMSDVYSFGVVLIELITGRKSLDKSRPVKERFLADWAIPLLMHKKSLLNIVDPRLGGHYPAKKVRKVAILAYQCLSRDPKARPLMSDIVKTLEAFQVPVEEVEDSNTFQ